MDRERANGRQIDPLEQQLEKLRDGFADRLPARLKAMGNEWRSLQDNGWSREGARALHRSVHGLIGTAGSLGFSSVAKTARRLERRLVALLEAADTPTAEQRTEIEPWFGRIEDASAEDRVGTATGVGRVVAPPAAASENRNLIVVIEEEGPFSRELSVQLGHFGFELQMYQSTEEVEESIERRRPAAVIMDVSSATGDLVGPEVAARVREAVGFRVPVIFFSNRSDIAARLDAVRAGCSGYFVKPINYSEVLETLDRVTRREPEPYRILIVDDEPDAAGFHAANLRAAGFETVTVNNPLNVTPHLVEFQPDLILMDVYMPGCSGVELAAVIRQEEAFVGIPIVFLSREADRMKQIAALGQGGDDFFTKPVEPDQLVAAIAARAQRGRTMRLYMERDGLTGLLSHSRIIEQLEVAVRRAGRSGGRLAVAMVDIDRFKRVNDSYGHLVGDQVLKALAYLLRQRLRLSDMLGRFGGDEYVVVLPDSDGGGAKEKLNVIRQHFNAIEHSTGDGQFSVTLSCGVAEFPRASTSLELIAAADDALYRAKRAGRNRVAVAGEED
jgi:diguanylate cyclase (GGDEF)-like protein